MRQGRSLVLLSAVMLIGGAGVAAAQALPVRFSGAVPSAALPAGERAWVLQVITVGGVMGRGTPSFTITSEDVDSAGLHDAIRQAPGWDWSGSAFGRTCSDCYSTLLILTTRDDAGTPRQYVAYWDPTTRAKLAKDVARLHDIAVARRK